MQISANSHLIFCCCNIERACACSSGATPYLFLDYSFWIYFKHLFSNISAVTFSPVMLHQRPLTGNVVTDVGSSAFSDLSTLAAAVRSHLVQSRLHWLVYCLKLWRVKT